jgi:hypothetical protein
MLTWLRSRVSAFLGRVPGKTSRVDTVILMIDADFSLDRELPREPRPPIVRAPMNKRDVKEPRQKALLPAGRAPSQPVSSKDPRTSLN